MARRRRAAAAVALIVPSLCREQLPSRLLDLHAENWDEVVEQHEYALVHFWAPFDSPSMKLDEVLEVVAIAQAADLSDQTQIVHARSDVTDERGYTPFLTEWGVTRLPTLVLFRQQTLPLGVLTSNCTKYGNTCMRLGAGCSCASVFPSEGRPSNHVPKPLTVHTWVKTQVDVHAANTVGRVRATRARQLHLYHDGRYSSNPNTGQLLNRDLHENADAEGSWGTGWLVVGGAPYIAPTPNADDALLARPSQCEPGPDGRCHGCTLHTVAPSGWDNPDTSLGWTGCETCGDQGS